MKRLLLVQGHVGIEAIGTAGLCDGLDKSATVAKLRTSTGAHGEREWVGAFTGLLRDALQAATSRDELVIDIADAIWREAYSASPDLVLVSHFHRDPQGRAMFARPDPALHFHNDAAAAESQRFIDRIAPVYGARTMIPVTDELASLNMTQLYNWCYIDDASAAVIAEWGNANLDAPILYAPGIIGIVSVARDCLLEHFNLQKTPTIPQRRASDNPPPPSPTPVARTLADVATDLERLAAELRSK